MLATRNRSVLKKLERGAQGKGMRHKDGVGERRGVGMGGEGASLESKAIKLI
jgi:hypothetical protein